MLYNFLSIYLSTKTSVSLSLSLLERNPNRTERCLLLPGRDRAGSHAGLTGREDEQLSDVYVGRAESAPLQEKEKHPRTRSEAPQEREKEKAGRV
jgi:hypothetical protein